MSVPLTPSLHTTVEQQFAQLLMSVTPSPVCETELLSFLCVEAFAGLCDGNGVVHRTTRQECERITTTVCAEEFQILLPILEANGFALSCDTFPNSSSICASKLNQSHNHKLVTEAPCMTTFPHLYLTHSCMTFILQDKRPLCILS